MEERRPEGRPEPGERRVERPGIAEGLASMAQSLLANPLVRLLVLTCAAIFTLYYIFLDVPLRWQLLTSVILLSIAVLVARFRPEVRLFLVLLSAAVSLRYIVWRGTHTLSFDTGIDAFLGVVLFLAEVYGIVVLLLGYFQTVEEYHRKPVPLPEDIDSLPSIDVMIPTYNEPVEIVARTARGALLMDYPKKRVYILDDGKRPEMRALAAELGCGYLTRADNRHAKAGNLNAALARTDGDLVAIFDADHVPVRSFLQLTVGFFLEDKKLALVQTPHHFFNPDPFQRNLLTQGRVPPEQEFFYHVILLGDDFWNSVFFCGSCALIRRDALDEIGGIAVETVTEDAHTGMKLHAAGWRSAYMEIPQAAGLATERYAFHVVQRMRWAQGMTQILRLDNPLLKRGLSFAQRLNYFNSMIHFLFGIPRLVYILAPLAYLLFGLHPLRGNPWEIMAYALPHILLAWTTNSLLFRTNRHSFWAEVYETSLAWQSAVVTTLTFLNPTGAKFNVTTKGEGTVDKAEFDWANARPTIILTALSVLGLVVAPIRFLTNPEEGSTILLNCGWVCFNIIVLSAALLVALEQIQRRFVHRLPRSLPAFVQVSPGEWLKVTTEEISQTGCSLKLPEGITLPPRTWVRVVGRQGTEASTAVRRVHSKPVNGHVLVGVEFEPMNQAQEQALLEVMFSAADSWIDFTAPIDNVGRGFVEVLRTPFRVARELARQREQLGSRTKQA